jgi:hypothetical protein
MAVNVHVGHMGEGYGVRGAQEEEDEGKPTDRERGAWPVAAKGLAGL